MLASVSALDAQLKATEIEVSRLQRIVDSEEKANATLIFSAGCKEVYKVLRSVTSPLGLTVGCESLRLSTDGEFEIALIGEGLNFTASKKAAYVF